MGQVLQFNNNARKFLTALHSRKGDQDKRMEAARRFLACARDAPSAESYLVPIKLEMFPIACLEAEVRKDPWAEYNRLYPNGGYREEARQSVKAAFAIAPSVSHGVTCKRENCFCHSCAWAELE